MAARPLPAVLLLLVVVNAAVGVMGAVLPFAGSWSRHRLELESSGAPAW